MYRRKKKEKKIEREREVNGSHPLRNSKHLLHLLIRPQLPRMPIVSCYSRPRRIRQTERSAKKEEERKNKKSSAQLCSVKPSSVPNASERSNSHPTPFRPSRSNIRSQPSISRKHQRRHHTPRIEPPIRVVPIVRRLNNLSGEFVVERTREEGWGRKETVVEFSNSFVGEGVGV